jgi:hypothetical protein
MTIATPALISVRDGAHLDRGGTPLPQTESPNGDDDERHGDGVASTCSSRKKTRWNAGTAASGVRTTSPATGAAADGHSTRAHVGEVPVREPRTPAQYNARKATARIVTGTSGRRVSSRATPTTKSVSPTTSRCRPSRSVKKTGRSADGATRCVDVVDHGQMLSA